MNALPESTKPGWNEKPSAGLELRDLSNDLLGLLFRRRALIIASGLMGLLAGGIYYLFSKPVYESRAQILVMQNDSALMATDKDTTQSHVSADLLATHMSLLQSKRIVEQALVESQLGDLPSVAQAIPEDGSAADYVIENMYVSRGGEGAARDARVLSVAFRHTDPEDCKLITEAILQEYKRFVKSRFQDVNKEAVGLINTARLELESDINELASDYRRFRSESPLLSATEGGANVYALQYEELSAELSTLMLAIDESRGRLELVKEQLAALDEQGGSELEKLALIDDRNAERLGILVTVERGESQTAAFQALQPERMAGATSEYSSLLTLKGELSQAIQEYGAKHPLVTTLQTQVREMESFLRERQTALAVSDGEAQLTPDDVMAAYVRLLENDLTAQQRRKLDLEKQIAKTEEKAKTLVDYELENEARLRELTRSETLYDSVVERLRDINMQKDSSALIQEVIEDPVLGKQVSPSKLIAMAIAMLCTVLLAGSTVIVSELTDKSVHSASELEEIYGTQIISHIPDMSRDLESRSILKRAARSKTNVSPSIMAFHDSSSRVSEAFRGIRTRIMLKLGGKHRLLAVTSPNQGDGKSTITANLAVSLASVGKSVLLVDCDLRRPSVHQLFGVEKTPGLVEVINEAVDFHDVCQQGPSQNLSILPSGEVPANPGELLASDRFSGLLQALKEKYDYIILDCPPVLPVSDPTIIAQLVDSVLLVTCLDSNGIPKARQCCRSLASAGVDLAGLIVNRADHSGGAYSYEGYEGDMSTYRQYQEASI